MVWMRPQNVHLLKHMMLFAGDVIIERWSQVGNFPIIGDVALKGIVGPWPLFLSVSFICPSSEE
jgi:hypothetical protein